MENQTDINNEILFKNTESCHDTKASVNICMITDKNYILPTCVAIKSMEVNKKKTSKYNIFVLVHNVDDDDIRKIHSMESDTINIEVISNFDSPILSSNVNISRHVSKAAMLKFLIPSIFKQKDRILYMDSDILVQGDLLDLYNIDFEDSYAAVVKDSMSIVGKNSHFINIDYEYEEYFNSGVILFNIKKCIENDATSKLIDYRLNGKNHFMDQDAFNIVFATKVKYISSKYNLLNYFFNNFDINILEDMYNEKFPRDINKIYEYAQVLHIGGKEKPWKYYLPYLTPLYRKYADMIGWDFKISYDISVIMPVYNAEKYLRESLDCLTNQTLENIEIVCINDGSTDNSLEILKEYAEKDERIIILTQKNRGSAAARNYGLKIAKGNYIGFMDSDDKVDSNYFKSMFNHAVKTKSDICATSSVKLFNDSRIISNKNVGLNGKSIISSIEDKGKIIISTGVLWNKIYKKSFLEKHDIKSLELSNAAEDNYFTDCSIIKANQIAVVNHDTYYYRVNENSQTQVLKDDTQFSMVDVYKAVDKFINDSKLPSKDKHKWLHIINKRKIADYKVFQQTMKPEYSLLFKQHFFNAFPDIKNKIEEIIVSLTSYPARINTVNRTIESLLNQSMKADKIILWLATEQFPNKEQDLPQELLILTKKGLTIDWCNDIRSYKKLIPSLKKYPESVIITADDDVLYDKNCIKTLYQTHIKHKNSVICHRGHYILFDKNKNILPYKKWKQDCGFKKPTYNILQTGVSAVLYPPNCFYKDVLNEKLFMSFAYDADDLWFWAMALLHGTKICIAKKQINKINYIAGTQEVGLWHQNVSNLGNDKKLQKLIEHYPKLLDKLKKKYPPNSFIENIFSIKNHWNGKHKILTLLGLQIKYKKKQKGEYSFFEKLFSITNMDIHKVITILGFKLKIKSKKLIQQKQMKKLDLKINNANKQIKVQQTQIESLQEQVNDQKESLEQYRKELKRIKQDTTQQTATVIRNTTYKLHKYLSEEKRPEALMDWYFEKTGEVLNIENPQSFNEKIQWMKLYDSTPEKTRLADKYLVRDWVKEKIGEEYLIPLLGIWDNFDEIDFDSLPEQFVLKCNHGSGYNIVVSDKSKFNKEDARKKINTWMNEDFAFRAGFEMQYSDIPRKIIAEEYIQDIASSMACDYHIHCFDGKPYVLYVTNMKSLDIRVWSFYDVDLNPIPLYHDKFSTPVEIKMNDNIRKMLEIAKNLSQNFNYVRVDMYCTDKILYFGEMTFTPSSGIGRYIGEYDWANIWGSMIKLKGEVKCKLQ